MRGPRRDNTERDRAIIAEYRKGIPPTVIGKRYGISATRVLQIVNGRQGRGSNFRRSQTPREEAASAKMWPELARFDDPARLRILGWLMHRCQSELRP